MTTRGLLVRFPGYPTQLETLLPDRRLAVAAGYLRDAGHRVEIADYGLPRMIADLFPASLRDAVSAIVRRFNDEAPANPLLTLHTLWSVHSTDRAFRTRRAEQCRWVGEEIARREWDFALFAVHSADDVVPALRIARHIRELCPGRKLGVLGRFVEMFAEPLLTCDDVFDCAFRAEGEASVVLWADRLSSRHDWTEIPNLVYRENGGVRRTRSEPSELSRAPLPAYDPDVYEAIGDIGAKIRLFEIEDSRGCPRSCYAIPRVAAEAWPRLRPVRLVCDEIRRLMAVYGARAFRFTESKASGASHVGAVALGLLRQGLDAVYSRRIHSCFVVSEEFPAWRVSGCRAVAFQVDTGSQRLLDDYFGRSAGVSRIEEMLRDAKEAGLQTIVRITYPTPADDYHTREETLRLLTRTKPHAVVVSLPEVKPRSVWFAQPARFGFWMHSKFSDEPWLNYRTRFPLPPERWQALPYRIGSLAAGQVVQEQESLISAIERLGVPTRVSEELAVAAELSGDDAADLARRITATLYSGDEEAVRELAVRMNGALCTSGKSLRAAVGN